MNGFRQLLLDSSSWSSSAARRLTLEFSSCAEQEQADGPSVLSLPDTVSQIFLLTGQKCDHAQPGLPIEENNWGELRSYAVPDSDMNCLLYQGLLLWIVFTS